MRHDLGGHVDQHETTTPTERKPLGRRTVLKGAAWSVPAVVAVGATPAFAATGDTVTFTSVVVDTPNVGAPTAYYINVSNSGSTVTVGGTVTSGATVTVTATGGYSATATTTGTSWTHTIPAASLPQGTIAFSASVTGPPAVSVPGPQTVVKDTNAPDIEPTIGTYNRTGSPKTLELQGTVGALATPTSDLAATLTNTSIVKRANNSQVTPLLATQTVGPGAWTHTFNDAVLSVGYDFNFSLSQFDGAGNSTTIYFTIQS